MSPLSEQSRNDYPDADEIRAFEAAREEDAALDASLMTDERGSLDYCETDDALAGYREAQGQADGFEEAA